MNFGICIFYLFFSFSQFYKCMHYYDNCMHFRMILVMWVSLRGEILKLIWGQRGRRRGFISNFRSTNNFFQWRRTLGKLIRWLPTKVAISHVYIRMKLVFMVFYPSSLSRRKGDLLSRKSCRCTRKKIPYVSNIHNILFRIF